MPHMRSVVHSRAKGSRPGRPAARARRGMGVESLKPPRMIPVAAIFAHDCEIATGGSGLTWAAPAQPWGMPVETLASLRDIPDAAFFFATSDTFWHASPVG